MSVTRGVPPRLTPTSYALLGAVSQAGPCSPYELKRVLARTVGPLWEVPHSQIYDEAARLARRQLLVEAQEGSGRRRLTYSITESGRSELLRWLRSPSPDRVELRDSGLLKLAFGAEVQPAELAHVAEDHARAWAAMAEHLTHAMDGRGAAYALCVAGAAAAFWVDLERQLRGLDEADDASGPDTNRTPEAA
ncbi:MAG: PadR family transcriptional regulator [Acidimicrobiales bacterium]